MVREYVAQGVEQGLARGREEGREQAYATRSSKFARARLDELPFGYEQILAGVHDEATLAAMVGELGGARERADVLAVFARLGDRTANKPGGPFECIRDQEFAAANAMKDLAATPMGYVWHHSHEIEDHDGIVKIKMQLVKEDVHEWAKHSGGIGIGKQILGAAACK